MKKLIHEGARKSFFVTSEGEVISTTVSGVSRTLNHQVTNGYKRVQVPCGNGKFAKKYVHHLVLEAFVGPRPEGMVACHNDGNSFNNHVDNLRWDTRSNNERDKINHGTSRFGRPNVNRKLTQSQAEDVRAEYASGCVSQYKLATKYGVTQAAICSIVRGLTY